MNKLDLYIVGALAAVGLVVYWDMRQGVNKVTTAAGNVGSKIGTSLADAVAGKPAEYLGYPSRYDAATRTWQVKVNGKWIIDPYQTAGARK